jgi:hypothetical protein
MARALALATIVTFGVALTPSLALADPSVDAYPVYGSVGNCLSPPTDQPGLVEFRSMLYDQYGIGGGIYRCDTGTNYEHGQGRALDFMVNHFDPAQDAIANEVLNWLLATDAGGNPHAMARRLGVGNIIWNGQSIELWSYNNNKVWEPYTPCVAGSPAGVCHTNHIHIAFSWAGALRQTSWFTTSPRPSNWYPLGSGTGSGSITGDSRADLIYWSNGQAVYYRNTGVDGNGAVMWDQGPGSSGFWVGSGWWQPATTYYFADITGDGRSDLVYRKNGGAVYYRNTGLDGNGAVMWDQGPGSSGFWAGSSWGLADTAYYFADITGDGRDDLVYRINGGAVYYRNTGVDGNGAVMWDQGPGSSGFWLGSSWGLADTAYYFADITGDGRDDLIYRINGGAVYYRNTGLDGNGAVMWDQGPGGTGFWAGSSWGLPDANYRFS